MKIPVLSEDPLKKSSKETVTKNSSSTERLSHLKKNISSEKKIMPLRRTSSDYPKRTAEKLKGGPRPGGCSRSVTQDNYEEVEMDIDSGQEDTGIYYFHNDRF